MCTHARTHGHVLQLGVLSRYHTKAVSNKTHMRALDLNCRVKAQTTDIGANHVCVRT